MNNKHLIVVVGPTAVGKTSIAIQLAQGFGTSVISADARQTFKELEIGTAKPTKEELSQVKHYFIDSHSITQEFSAGAFADEAENLIEGLFKSNDYLILCGGSGLYIKALLEGFDSMPTVPKEIRDAIIDAYETNGIEWLQKEVSIADPEFYEKVDKSNPQRLMRALEVVQSSGQKFSSFKSAPKKELAYQVIKVGLNLDRDELYNRIDMRMDQMIDAGLFEEAERFYMQRNLNALQTVGYSEIFGFMNGEYDREEAIRLLKRNSRRYAKRQLTWFNADKEIVWFSPKDYEAILSFIKEKSTIL